MGFLTSPHLGIAGEYNFLGMTAVPGRSHIPKQRFRNSDMQAVDLLPERGKNKGIPVAILLLDPDTHRKPRWWEVIVCEEHNAHAHIVRESGNTCRLDIGRYAPAKHVPCIPNMCRYTGQGRFLCAAPKYLTLYTETYAKRGLTAGPADVEDDEDDLTFEQIEQVEKSKDQRVAPVARLSDAVVRKWRAIFDYSKATGVSDAIAALIADRMMADFTRE